MNDGMPSSINKSMFHQLMVIIVPGSLVVIPFCMAIYLLQRNVGFQDLYRALEGKHFAIYSIISFLILLVGMILENIGSFIEDKILDYCNNVSVSAWRFYLFTECGDASLKVIHKYVDSIAFRYKFELSLIPALCIFFFEWLWILYLECSFFNCLSIALITVFILVALLFTCWQAKMSCKYLNDLRCAFMAACNDFCKECNKKNNDYLKESCEKCRKVVEGRCNVCGQDPKDS